MRRTTCTTRKSGLVFLPGSTQEWVVLCIITCPFCRSEEKTYIWFLAGHGKRCSCGARQPYLGMTLPPGYEKYRKEWERQTTLEREKAASRRNETCQVPKIICFTH